MPTGAGVGLKFLQWFIRGVQFCCAALVLAIFSYFLATLSNHNLHISNHIRAVEGISGLATLYTIIGLVLLCCLAGFPFTSFIAIVLDACFASAFIYVAWVNRNGASSCDGYLDTPYGQGNANDNVEGSDGFTNLPSFHQACRMQTACLAVSIVAIFFFIFSIFVEIFLARHRKKEKRFGPSPMNNYTEGSGRRSGGGLFGWRRKRNEKPSDMDNQLPEHTTPEQVRTSYNTEATAVGQPEPGTAATGGFTKQGDAGYGYNTGSYGAAHDSYGTYAPLETGTTGQPGYTSNPYRYDDGVYDRR